MPKGVREKMLDFISFGIDAERSQLMNECSTDACCLTNWKVMKRKRTNIKITIIYRVSFMKNKHVLGNMSLEGCRHRSQSINHWCKKKKTFVFKHVSVIDRNKFLSTTWGRFWNCSTLCWMKLTEILVSLWACQICQSKIGSFIGARWKATNSRWIFVT